MIVILDRENAKYCCFPVSRKIEIWLFKKKWTLSSFHMDCQCWILTTSVHVLSPTSFDPAAKLQLTYPMVWMSLLFFCSYESIPRRTKFNLWKKEKKSKFSLRPSFVGNSIYWKHECLGNLNPKMQDITH